MADCLRLKKSNCKNCYKCIRHCPVKSIRFSANQAHIVEEECILCGQCFVVCPQNAKEIRNDIEKAQVLIAQEPKVIASLAPSFVANYPGINITSMEEALKKLGFYAVEETAVGAAIVSSRYESLIDEGSQEIIISSCCYSVNLMIQKHFPEVIPFLAPVVSPMLAHGMSIKERYPDAKVVFIGPCISKKAEAEEAQGIIDVVLTFEELTEWLNKQHITLEALPEQRTKFSSRFYPTSGGILKSMDLKPESYHYMTVDGLENCINALKDIGEGKLSKCFIEMSACSGSCIGGPVMDRAHRSPIRDYLSISSYGGDCKLPAKLNSEDNLARQFNPFMIKKPMPSILEINEILKKMGKTKPEDELNCGSCGYDTCREKARAVYLGKADLTMCLPYLKDKAETFSDHIIRNTPNGVILLNESLEVQEINEAARKIMNIRASSDVLGEHVIRILDPTPFLEVMDTCRNVHERLTYLPEYNKYIEESIIYDRSYHILTCIMRDVTEAERQRERKESLSRKTIEITDKVIEKQMRVVQEIASLLGETTAETKIALTRLKETLKDE